MKKQILLILLVATIILTGCKEDTPTPIDRSVFVGKWIGQSSVAIPSMQSRIYDTIILVLKPNNSTQLIDTFNNRNTIYTITDSKNYTKSDVVTTDSLEGYVSVLIKTNTKGVLRIPTILEETGVATLKFGDKTFNPGPYSALYRKE